MRPHGAARVALVVVLARASPAEGREADVALGQGDATYGRIEGDVGLVAGVGATLSGDVPRAALDVRARYLDTAGLFVTYEDGFGAATPGPTRVGSGGFEVRPLFLARWLTGREFGSAWPDLLVDSFGLEVGAFLEDSSVFGWSKAPGMQLGLGLEVPLGASATGAFLDLHGGVRWSDPVMAGGPVGGSLDRAGFLTVTLAYHAIVATHLVDAGDRSP